ncbi:sensor histidine kinase [Deminuibacter soli]|uniref:histidine kinase n=1 Tax=Deminuibacter soli TaxID=2291815 RepID=A0A3E1NDP5_9BACT|nr:HAMP domain-containing sensor histidine kinase [Deminuibacter soli]RFM25997.1 sensor histidine kinase [Deminuibacter soli]
MKTKPAAKGLSAALHQLLSQPDSASTFEEQQRNRLISICLLIAIPFMVTFLCLNIIQHLYFQFCTTFLLLAGNLTILYFNRKGRHYTARAVLINLSVVLFAVPALFYRNGAENYLLLNIVITAILFHNKWHMYGFSTLNGLLFLAIKTVQYHNLDQQSVSWERLMVNLLLMVLLLVLSLHYFKSTHRNHKQTIEQNNRLLSEQQQQLNLQKLELEKQNQQLQQLNQSKEKLLTIIAHDMRSPIAALQSSLELLHEELITQSEFEEIAGQLGTQVESLQEGLTNMLHWSKTQMNGIRATPADFPLAVLVNQKVELFKQAIDQKQLQVQVQVSECLQLHADRNHCKLILRNLLSNAIKFSYPGGRLSITAAEEENMVQVSIADTGKGMPPEKMQQLFAGKDIASTSGTMNEIGTGIGLLLCREFVEKNGGSISVAPNQPSGTVFSFRLPAIKNPA